MLSIDRSASLQPVAVDTGASKASGVIPVPPVNPSVGASPPLQPTPGVVNLVNPALQSSQTQQPLPNEGEANYTSVPDPLKNSASTQVASHDWVVQKPAPEKTPVAPTKTISQVLMDNLKSMWTASASAVQVEQVGNTLNRPTPIQPSQIPGDMAKQVLTYQPTPIKKSTKI